MEVPVSRIDKMLHYDRNYTRSAVCGVLGVTNREYRYMLEQPWKNFTVEHMEKMSILLDVSIITVFWAVWSRPRKSLRGEEQVRLLNSLERLGIEREV
jgi:hypothetical protein